MNATASATAIELATAVKTATTQPATRPAPNLMFSHMGISVKDMAQMEAFYSGVLGFTVTDRGVAGGMDLVFLSRDPMDHHQVVLASGRPDVMPANTRNPQFGPSINQISFKMGSLADLRDMKTRLDEVGGMNQFPANHGIAWSIYAHDPEGNNLEFFVDTDWYIDQPFLIPLDFAKSDEEIVELTRSMCETSEGYEPYVDWRKRVALRMTGFKRSPSAPAPVTIPSRSND
jgi:catechol 2,3-dioxygenase